MRVLIVDDSMLAGHALKKYFTNLNHEVIAMVRDGKLGFEMYLKEKPDLMTIDQIMPGLSGNELVKLVNQEDQKSSRHTKLMIISSDTVSADEKKEMRVDHYIVKPVTFEKIKTIMQEY